MKFLRMLLFLFIILSVFFACKSKTSTNLSKVSNDSKLRIISEINPPFNFIENNKNTGLVVDVIKEIQKSLNSNEKIEMMNWKKGYELAKTQSNIALFTTSLNSQRKDLFKWVGPVCKIEYSLYAKKDAEILVNSIEDAKKISAISTIEEYADEQELKKLGFSNLKSSKDEVTAINKIFNNEADLIALNNITILEVLKKINHKESDIKKVFTFSTNLMYIAFSKSTSDDIVLKWQNELDKLKSNGKFNEIYNKWLPNDKAPGTLQFVTENYPPISFEKDGIASGYAVDIVNEISKRLKNKNEISVMSWNAAYNMALINPNIVLFSTTKTKKRENLFEWLGPIGSYFDKIYVKKGNTIKINNIEDARKLNKIGTVNGWFSQEYLKSKNFTNLVQVDDPNELVELLLSSKVDACVFTDMTAPDIFKNAGQNISKVEPVFTIKKYDFFITFSKGTNKKIIDNWTNTFVNIQNDGTLTKIKEKYSME